MNTDSSFSFAAFSMDCLAGMWIRNYIDALAFRACGLCISANRSLKHESRTHMATYHVWHQKGVHPHRGQAASTGIFPIRMSIHKLRQTSSDMAIPLLPLSSTRIPLMAPALMACLIVLASCGSSSKFDSPRTSKQNAGHSSGHDEGFLSKIAPCASTIVGALRRALRYRDAGLHGRSSVSLLLSRKPRPKRFATNKVSFSMLASRLPWFNADDSAHRKWLSGTSCRPRSRCRASVPVAESLPHNDRSDGTALKRHGQRWTAQSSRDLGIQLLASAIVATTSKVCWVQVTHERSRTTSLVDALSSTVVRSTIKLQDSLL